ncbi:MAG: hypothetical protein A4E63_00128 [Syntrophorhabdus sp. PtaU1.Bin050]|nr:MAG: hypothetical protein A4E63_00128 [Syntrophorhabdus sp. PtaU1.Bin050]
MNPKKIWIDLDNSPHVPFFNPIMKELKKLDYEVIITARDCSQTCELADMFHIRYQRIGRHFGKKKSMKIAGTVLRALQLSKAVRPNDVSVAVSHGSRAQMISALLLHTPSMAIMDYEHVKGFVRPNWVMIPDVIEDESVRFDKDRIMRYPGIKEDVYVPDFNPDPAVVKELGLNPADLIVTIRPPATEAHYHNIESEALFFEVVNRIGHNEQSRMVVLPRNDAQRVSITKAWPQWCSSRKIVIPDHVVNGLNLLWHSDLAISGGGTMNREAAALGVPVYSIFRGKIGDVDRYLAQNGRLVLLENLTDVSDKILIEKRKLSQGNDKKKNGDALHAVVDGIVKASEQRN